VTVNGAQYTAANSSGTWTLAAGLIAPPLRAGAYTVTVKASTTQATVSNTGQLTVQSTVVSEYLYYANSKYDNAAKGGTVDKARATNKHALLPGQTATSANYSDYGDGINGILVDVAGLESPTNFNLSDLTLKYGDTTSTSTWTTAPAPSKFSVKAGGGDSGSDEVVLTWANNAIPTGNWLQVTVAADQNTGLASPYTFYFGSLIGDVNGDGKVTTADVTAIQKQVGKTAGIASAYDINRDGKINAADVTLVKKYVGDTLAMIVAPAVAAHVVMAAPMLATAASASPSASLSSVATTSATAAKAAAATAHDTVLAQAAAPKPSAAAASTNASLATTIARVAVRQAAAKKVGPLVLATDSVLGSW
jgi:hypothetical protein